MRVEEMTKNHVAELRKAAGLTIDEFGARLKLSVRTLRYVEAGIGHIRLDHALRIAKSLGVDPDAAFPAVRSVLDRTDGADVEIRRLSTREDEWEDLASAGIDADPFQWRLRFRLTSGLEVVDRISGPEKRALWSRVQDPWGDDGAFVVFNGEGRRLALNPSHLRFVQFLYDRAEDRSDSLPEEPSMAVDVYFADGKEPQSFEVEPDEICGHSAGAGFVEEGGGQLRRLLAEMENGPAEGQLLSFEDGDGERVFLNPETVALVSIPLELIEPTILATSEDEVG
jgi:transcriptional regulator with XRE-family HTH domain